MMSWSGNLKVAIKLDYRFRTNVASPSSRSVMAALRTWSHRLLEFVDGTPHGGDDLRVLSGDIVGFL